MARERRCAWRRTRAACAGSAQNADASSDDDLDAPAEPSPVALREGRAVHRRVIVTTSDQHAASVGVPFATAAVGLRGPTASAGAEVAGGSFRRGGRFGTSSGRSAVRTSLIRERVT